jgi:hypothetical protein
VGAVDLFLEHGAPVHVAHVVTPQNEDSFPDFLEQMWTLGVASVRVTPVVPTGAAARRGRWDVDRRSLRRAVEAFSRRRGEGMRVRLRPGTAAGLATPEDAAPQAMLVRPSGAVRTDSLRPFAFGHAIDDGLEECWRRIVVGWLDPEVTAWSRSLRSTRALPDSELVAYLDEDPRVGEAGTGTQPSRRFRGRRRSRATREQALAQPLPSPVGAMDRDGRSGADSEQAAAHVRELALSRPYRLGSVRCTLGAGERYVSRVEGGDVVRLNRTAGRIMDALDRGTPRDAVELLVADHPDVGRDQLERDVLDSARSLVSRRVVVPASAALSPRG